MEKKIQNLKKLLEEKILSLEGNFVNKNAGYENDICEIIGLKKETNRYWDCIYKEENLFIEFKKGISIWLDLVRYSEILLKKNEEAKNNTFTLFFIPDSNRSIIETIVGLKTNEIIKSIGLDQESALNLLSLKEHFRSLNAQVKLTVRDIKVSATFIINKKKN